MVSILVVTTKQADCVSTGGRSRGMSRLAILAAWVLPVVGAPALAQTIVTQGVSGNSFIAGQAVTYNSLSISPYLSPGMLLLTTTNAASATSPSLTVDAMAGTNFSGGASSQSIYIPLTGISVQAGGSQYQGGSSLPSWMNGPAVTVTNSATLAGYVQTATLPTGGPGRTARRQVRSTR